MSKIYEETMQGLLEAIEIEKGNIPLTERSNMPAKTFYVADDDQKLIDDLINIRKNENISQIQLAEMIGSSQQAVSRFEKKTHSPSVKLLSSIASALGYNIKLVQKEG